ncbi:MAG: hypothetical protein APR54_07780 [Candidatus Cloacimonas sp. SDB]|nr:MAG: hypothetical protein APR54_07780 [Candidatus Cloacimonas sp. SDB]
MLIVSACLAGINCRYDGLNNYNPRIAELVRNGEALPVCPEQLGGLSTPRLAAEIQNGKVINTAGKDVSEYFTRGAFETLKIAKLINCRTAILKQRSPSCGYGEIYDGTHSGKTLIGNGITALLLLDNGINLKTEDDF